MDCEEALELLRGGQAGIREWNKRRKKEEVIPEFYEADLSDTDLRCANLKFVNLISTNLIGANLSDANLTAANLTGANLTGANLSDADLTHAILCDANLSFTYLVGSKLWGVKFIGADLSDTNLSNTYLAHVYFNHVLLHNANLKGSDLAFARLTFSSLENAQFDGANMYKASIDQLRSFPKPPTKIILQEFPNAEAIILEGYEAANFFIQPETVSILMDRELPHLNNIIYEMSILSLKAFDNWPKDILFKGTASINGRTALNFEAKSIKHVYKYLPLLLVPFYAAQGIDFAKSIPKDEDVTNLSELDISLEKAKNIWKLEGFSNAVPEKIKSKNETINFEFIANFKETLPPGHPINFSIFGDLLLTNITQKAGDYAFQAANSSITNSTLNMKISTEVQNIDIGQLASEIAQLKEALEKVEKKNAENYKDLAVLTEAEEAASEGDKSKVATALSKAGKRIFEKATDIGLPILGKWAEQQVLTQ